MRGFFSSFLYGLLFLSWLVPTISWSSESTLSLPPAPINTQDTASLQRGVQTFVNYCLSCHSAQAMRYNRLQDIGLTEKQIKTYLLPSTAKVGDVMQTAMLSTDAVKWFGVPPPDLSVIARARGADWLYAYLRSFYRDPARPTGWNNLVFDKVSMPHVLWELQGEQVLESQSVKNPDGSTSTTRTLKLQKPGSLTKIINNKAEQLEYDKKVADLVNYLVYMGEPIQNTRKQIGYVVVLFLIFIFAPLTYFLKKEYWREIN